MDMRFLGGLLMACAAITSVAADDIYNTRLDSLSAQYAQLISTPRGEEYENSILPSHNSFWKKVYAVCAPAGLQAGADSFRAIAVIDRSGVISEFLPMPSSPYFNCFTKEMVGKHYHAPPSHPYLVRYSINLSDEVPH